MDTLQSTSVSWTPAKVGVQKKGVHSTPALSVTGTLCITVMIHLAAVLNLNFASTDFMYWYS